MKKILILTAGYGEGHNTAARNVGDALRAEAPGEVEVEVLDLMALTHRRINELLRRAYLVTIERAPALWEKLYQMIDSGNATADALRLLKPMRQALEARLRAEPPWAVVSTYPVYNYLIDVLYPEATRRPFAQLTVVTDSITVNSIWHRCGSDALIVPNPQTAAVLEEAGVREGVHVLGFPVSLRFTGEGRRKKVPGPGERWRVLYGVNAGKREAPDVVEALLRRGDVDLTVTVGRDEELRRRIEAVAQGRPLELLGWTDRMPELMEAAHLFIGKAGGATVQEALAACTPMVITQVIPGQEEGNARLILENGCGCVMETPGFLPSVVAGAFAHGGALWKSWHEGTIRLSRPHAAIDIARLVLETRGPKNG